MKIIDSTEFDAYWKSQKRPAEDAAVETAVREIIEAVRNEGDAGLKRFAARFDKSSPERLEVPPEELRTAGENLRREEPELAAALTLAAGHIRRFAELQKKQFADFETEMESGLYTGQRVIPVERAAVYVPAGRFPLFSSVLMGMIPAMAAGVDEVLLASPPMEDGLPHRRILAAAAIAAEAFTAGRNASARPGEISGSADFAEPENVSRLRVFAAGGAHAIAALALGTETVPRASIIAGPGNRYVAAAKRMLFGETGIDFIAGPTDVLIIAESAETDLPGAGGNVVKTAELIAADMLAQAEHDPDARARALVPSGALALEIEAVLERQLARLEGESQTTALSSLDTGGLIIIYHCREEAIRIANIIAPEHLELHLHNPGEWTETTEGETGKKAAGKERLRNYGSLFTGPLSAEVLGDYSAGINHTLPTSGSARWTGGLSVRHFLKTVTTLRCKAGPGFEAARQAAEIMGRAEGLLAHAESAALRRLSSTERT